MFFYSHAFYNFIPVLVGILILFRIVCRWRIFGKLSIRKWLCLIPVVSDYLVFKKTWKTWPFVVLLILAVAAGLAVQLTAYMNIYLPIPTYVKSRMTVISLVCIILITVLQYKHLAFTFGHDIGYLMGLLFLNPVFLGMLAFSKDTFHADLAAMQRKELKEYTRNNRTLTNRILSTVSALVILFASVGYIGYVMMTEQQPGFMVKHKLNSIYEKTSGKVNGDGKVIYPAAGTEGKAGEFTADSAVTADAKAGARDLFFPDKSDVSETTVYMYLIGSNLEDATGSASINLAQIKEATAAGSNLKFIIEAGGTGRWFTDGFKDRRTARYKIKDGVVTLLQTLPDNTCMSKEKTLENFLKWANENYPSERRMLWFWDHGGGLSGYGADTLNPREGRKMLSLYEIEEALKEAGGKYDVIGFDACLMQTMEVGLAMEPYADYLLASEESEPHTGMYYTAAFSELVKNPSLDSVEFGAMMCSSYDQSLKILDAAAQAGSTMSMTDLRLMPEAADAFIGYLRGLDRNFKADKSSFANMSTARYKAYEFQQEDQIDLIDFIDQSDITDEERTELLSRITPAIAVRNAATASHINGLAVYMPYDDIDGYTSAYETLTELNMRSERKVYNDFASIICSQKGPDNKEKSYEYEYEPWYMRGFANYDISLYRQNIPLKKVGHEYAIILTNKEWETITGYEQGLRMKVGHRFVDLGSDNVYDLDDKGHYMVEFDDTWVAINGVVVALHPGTPRDEGNGRVVYTGTVDATLNFMTPIKIYIEWVNEGDVEGEGVIKGYLPADEDSQDSNVKDATGVPRGLKQFKTSNVITFLYDWYDEDGNFLSTAAGHLPIKVGLSGLEVTQKDISSEEYYYYGMLCDVLNRVMETEKIHHDPH